MKKGYQCPQCGNKKAEAMLMNLGGCKPRPVLMAPRKLLQLPHILISCAKCGCQGGAERFRTRRSGAVVNAL